MPSVERSRSFLIASKVAGMKKPEGSDSDKRSSAITAMPAISALLIALIRIVVLIIVFVIVFP